MVFKIIYTYLNILTKIFIYIMEKVQFNKKKKPRITSELDKLL